MFYVYFLKSKKDNGLYIGKTNDLRRRFSEHNSGTVSSTRSRRPLVLLGHESYKTEKEAIWMERKWKKGYMRQKLKIKYSL